MVFTKKLFNVEVVREFCLDIFQNLVDNYNTETEVDLCLRVLLRLKKSVCFLYF